MTIRAARRRPSINVLIFLTFVGSTLVCCYGVVAVLVLAAISIFEHQFAPFAVLALSITLVTGGCAFLTEPLLR